LESELGKLLFIFGFFLLLGIFGVKNDYCDGKLKLEFFDEEEEVSPVKIVSEFNFLVGFSNFVADF
jgi:hypothetical protein